MSEFLCWMEILFFLFCPNNCFMFSCMIHNEILLLSIIFILLPKRITIELLLSFQASFWALTCLWAIGSHSHWFRAPSCFFNELVSYATGFFKVRSVVAPFIPCQLSSVTRSFGKTPSIALRLSGSGDCDVRRSRSRKCRQVGRGSETGSER